MATAFCWMTARSTLACSASAGTESTATISKTQSFPQTGSCLPRSCSQAIKRDVKSASRISYQGQKTSATAQTVLPSKSGRKLPSASAGNGQCSLKQVSGCGSPVETSAQSAEAPTEAVAETAVLTRDTVCDGRSTNSLLAPIGRRFKKEIFCCLERLKTECLCHAF